MVTFSPIFYYFIFPGYFWLYWPVCFQGYGCNFMCYNCVFSPFYQFFFEHSICLPSSIIHCL